MPTYRLMHLVYFQCFPCFNQPGQPFVYHPRTKLSTKRVAKEASTHTTCCLTSQLDVSVNFFFEKWAESNRKKIYNGFEMKKCPSST